MPITVSLAKDAPRGAAVGIPVFSSGRGVRPPAGVSTEVLARRGFEAKVGQTLVLPGGAGGTRILVGLGDQRALSADTVRTAGAALVRAAWNETAVASDLLDALPARVDRAAAAQAFVEGVLLAGYQFAKYKATSKPCRVARFVLTGRGGRLVQQGADRGEVVAGAVAFARDLINEPPGAMTPSELAAAAERIAADNGLAVTVWDETEIERERLGGLHGVSLGSDEPARLIKLVYEPGGPASANGDRGRGGRARRRRGDGVPTLALVGKGITFDSGGLSLKPPEGMVTMKTDMSGAAAVLAVMSVIGRLRPAARVVAYCCATENLPGPKAIKPGDILRIRNGKTIEVLNTDAEGRLVLADGLSLAVEEGADAIVDLATLTGAAVTALGREIAAYFANDDALGAQVKVASERAGEALWQLPLAAQYRKHIDSEIADIKNTGAPGGQAGSIAGALVLKEFVGDTPWVHVDIAGPARSDADDGIYAKGGTGFGVRTLVELVSSFGGNGTDRG